MGSGYEETKHQILKPGKKNVKYSSPWIALHITSHRTICLIFCVCSSKAFENITYFIVSAVIVLRSCCPKTGHQASFCKRTKKSGPKTLISSLFDVMLCYLGCLLFV